MIIGEVIGTVVATRKTDTVEGLPLRLVRKLTVTTAPTTSTASDGELVLVTSGSASRQTHLTDDRPVDAIIMAIIDTWQLDGAVQYTKE